MSAQSKATNEQNLWIALMASKGERFFFFLFLYLIWIPILNYFWWYTELSIFIKTQAVRHIHAALGRWYHTFLHSCFSMCVKNMAWSDEDPNLAPTKWNHVPNLSCESSPGWWRWSNDAENVFLARFGPFNTNKRAVERNGMLKKTFQHDYTACHEAKVISNRSRELVNTFFSALPTHRIWS